MPSEARTIISNIAELIEIPSVSSVTPDWDMPNQPVIDRLAERLEAGGWRVELIEVPDKPGKTNLLATLGRGDGGLVLSGHTDTVPCDPQLWSSDPFALAERDNRLYGLGTADMKSFLALAMTACAGIDTAALKAPLMLLATADEESSMAGARALVAAGQPKARFAVIGEPTGLKPVRMHKGILMEAIRVEGRSGHSSDPSLGANALEGMHQIIAALLRWRDRLQAQSSDAAFAVPVSTMNLGHIRGGDNPNRICGSCELHIDVRMLPGLDRQALRADLRKESRDAVTNDQLVVDFDALFDGVDPMLTPPESELVRAAEQLTGSPAEAVAFATEAPFLANLGMEVVVLGPGHIDQAHQPDEYLELGQIPRSIEILQALIQRFCL
jgi:acetylornithine deacetylase